MIHNKFIPMIFLSPSGSCHSDIKHMDSLLTTFLIVYLADTSEISEAESDSNDLYIDYKFKGYRLISEVIKIKDMSNNSTSEFSIFTSGLHNSGNFIDKIGLARNI